MNAPVNRNWMVFAEDTNLTFQQITHLCDSMFADAGFFAVDTTEDTSGQEEKKSLDGSSFRDYCMWKMFWYSRCDSNGKLHNIYADASASLMAQQKTTSAPSSCCGGSPVQNDSVKFPHTPRGWKFTGPQGIVKESLAVPPLAGTFNTLTMYLGRIEEISVNPSNRNEVYALDPFGGLWYCNNAESAPNNTWISLSDHLPFVPGTGISDYYVDFGTTPHRIYAVAAVSYRPVIPNISDAMPKTLGIFYSSDNGATFSHVNVSSAIDFSQDPVLDMKYWSGSAGKFIFLATRSKIYRLNVTTTPTSPSTTEAIVRFSDYLTDVGEAGDNVSERFRGFTELAFLPSDPTYMFVTTRSNIGYNSFPSTSGLYRISNCHTCTSCTLTPMKPNRTGDYLNNVGEFALVNFPDDYPGWRRTQGTLPIANRWRGNTFGFAECLPSSTSGVFSSLEVPVAGSYFENVTYAIEFELELPAKTEVQVLLKDVKSAYQGVADWGYGGFRGAYTVGSGIGGTPGVYTNTTLATITLGSTLYTDNITATDYVDRLEFAATSLPGYSGGTVKLDKIKVKQAFSHRISDMVINSLDKLLCTVDDKNTDPPALITQKLDGTSPSTSPTTYTTDGDGLALSAGSSDSIYQFAKVSGPAKIKQLSLSTTSTNEITGNSVASYMIHDDVRAVTALTDPITGYDVLYVGCDGGIAKRTATRTWVNLNGTGLNTSWTIDVGSSIFTGEVGLAASDCHWMWSEAGKQSRWTVSAQKNDGAQMMYGKRQETKNARFYGRSDNGPFIKFGVESTISPEVVTRVGKDIFQSAMSKTVATYGGEFFAEGGMRKTQNPLNPIFKVKVDTGSGTTASPYLFDLDNKITQHVSYVPDSTVSTDSVLPVQALSPDLYDPNYIMSYHTSGPWSAGYFSYAYSSDAFASQPSWTEFKNGTNKSLMTLVCDPRSSGSTKRLWAGAAGYGTSGIDRVFVSTLNAMPTSWTSMSTGLPGGPVNILVYDEQSRYLFAGTDQGVYSFDVGKNDFTGSEQWKCYSLNLPNSYVTDLDINQCTGKIYAGFYGRGVYEADLPPQYAPGGTDTIDYTDNCGFRYVNADDTWNGELFEFRSIYVASGVKLTLDGCTLNMGKDRHIIVAKGGKLVVKKSKITNACGQLWGGIQVKGNPGLPQTPANQGWVVITGNSIIEHAVTGVTNYNPDPKLYPHPSGGIIQVIGSTFLNNRTSVAFEEYHNMSGTTLMPNISHFTLSKFILDTNFRYQQNESVPSKMVQLQGVEGVNFRGCSFIERRYAYSGFVDGIQAVNAGFNVVPFCAVTGPAGCTGETRTRFKGLRNGVYTRATFPGLAAGAVTIDRTDFDTSTVGVQISVQEGVSVTRCRFNIGRGIVNTFVENSSGLPASCGRNIGVFTQSTKVYRIEGNTFSGLTNSFGVSPWHNIGVLAINSGNYTNRVYRNSFDHLTYGVLGLGDNSTHHPSYAGYGLQVSCNTFNSNTNDIYSGGSYIYEGIGVQQRGPTYYTSASNTFSGSTKNIVNPNYNRPLQYYNHTGTPILSGNASLHSAVVDACPVTIPTGSGSSTAYPSYMTATASSLDLSSLAGYKTAYYTHRTEYQAAVADIEATIDRGNTDSVINFIDTSTNYTTMFTALGSISPYMSAATLRKTAEVASQTNYEDVINLLAENPEVIANYDELDKLADIAGMTAEDFTNLWNMACSTLTGRSTLEGAARSAGAAMDESAGMVLMALRSPIDTNVAVTDTTFAGVCLDTNSMYYLLDSNSVFHHPDTLDTWLATIGKAEMQYERLGLKYLKGDYNSILTAFNSIDTQYMDTAVLSGHKYMKSYLGVLLDARVNGRSLYQLSDSDLLQMKLEAYPPLDISASRIYAANVKTDPISHFPCAAAPPVSKYPRVVKDRIRDSSTVYKVRVYPNPSKGDVHFEYTTTENNAESVNVKIMNLLGETVFEHIQSAKSGGYDWNTGNLPSGVYIYVASVNNRIVGKGKLVLVK